ncbi:HAD family hydrolase [Krasilnikovia sp. M28-CT-15]|uniref:HAD family hydrolase n=1 Tax=Krasilnikovia sp. M28-CT-15 TaxID=3373540 RepID=UPI0038775798
MSGWPAAGRAALFDFDGTIVDSEMVVASVLLELLAEDGAVATLADIGPVFGGSSAETYRVWTAILTRLCGPNVDVADMDRRLEERSAPRLSTAPVRAGAVELVRAARRAGWRVGLGTGRRRAQLTAELARLGLANAFDAICTVDDVAHGKPEPDIYLALADDLDVPPARCAVVEDSLPGVRAALAAGMPVLLCPSPVTAACHFPAAVRRIDSLTMGLDELAGLLDDEPPNILVV